MGRPTKICITGGNGFIGKNLNRLLAENKKLKIINFKGDLLKRKDVKSFFKKNKGIDQIVHLVGLFSGEIEDLLAVNVEALAVLLDVAVQNSVKKVVYTSTGAVYGEPIRNTSSENDLLAPNTNYSMTKKLAEDVIMYFHGNYGLDYVILRFPNVYGPNNNKGVIQAFKDNIKNKGEITIFGDGKQSRNFLHVEDACNAIKKSIYYNNTDIFNISNPKKVSINDLVKIFQQKYDFKIKHCPPDNDLKDLLLNIIKAEKKLKFQPKHKEVKI